MTVDNSIPASDNRLLAALPSEDYRRISQSLIGRPVFGREILQRRDEPIREIYFPGRSLCSLILTTSDGAMAEVAVVGAEGFVGVEAALGISQAISDGTVQVAGDRMLQAMDISAFRQEFDRRGAFHSYVMEYVQRFIGFTMQSVACNGLHSADARCCRWLLHAQDRLASNDLPITHDLLSTMLAVRRPTVTLIVGELVQAGIISNGRGRIRIEDRAGLEARSCECYTTVKKLFSQAPKRGRWQLNMHDEQRWSEAAAHIP